MIVVGTWFLNGHAEAKKPEFPLMMITSQTSDNA